MQIHEPLALAPDTITQAEWLFSQFKFMVVALIGTTGWALYGWFTSLLFGLNFRRDVRPLLLQDPKAMAEFQRGRLNALAVIVGLSMLAGVISP